MDQSRGRNFDRLSRVVAGITDESPKDRDVCIINAVCCRAAYARSKYPPVLSAIILISDRRSVTFDILFYIYLQYTDAEGRGTKNPRPRIAARGENARL